MSNFSLLSEAMQRRIWKMGWPSLNEVQEAAIPAILGDDVDVVVAAETASGKTEAAFLPILSQIESSYAQGIKVLYVSPLKALINDQFARIQGLCDETGIPVHRWHGDVAQHAKKKTISTPAGILQITPESIESLCINRTGDLKRLFHALEFVIIDEVHAFLGTDRGTHLRSLLGRIQAYADLPVRFIALSATIGDYTFARHWLRPEDPERVTVLVPSGGRKPTQYCVMYFPASEDGKRPVELFEDMRDLTRDGSALIFCNARGEVEETAYMLNRLAGREGVGEVYLPHHSSIDAAERERVETTLKTARSPISVVSTSTLEMGIDIGNVDMVIQVDSTFSVASLKQRLGRSGRRHGASRVFQLYASSDADLLQAVAVTELFLEGWTEPPEQYAIPYDVLFHQLISLCAEGRGATLDGLLSSVRSCEVFSDIPETSVRHLLQHMIDSDYLERLAGKGELIVGIAGERLLRSREFYAVFKSADVFEVVWQTRTIGTLTRDNIYEPGAELILAGKLWKVVEVDETKGKIFVQPSSNPKRPLFGGDPVPVHHHVRSLMADVLYGEKAFPYLFGHATAHLESMRIEGRQLGITPQKRLLIGGPKGVTLRAFAGDKVARTLALWIEHVTGRAVTVGRMGQLAWEGTLGEALSTLRLMATSESPTPEELVSHVPEEHLLTTKFGAYLPEWAKRQMHTSAWVGIPSAQEFLSSVHFVPAE
jgi:ATP-dependent helicase Lhr and Lhr-like helicase